jgi:SPP1 gp7 family putative phage head morphogenesis protein
MAKKTFGLPPIPFNEALAAVQARKVVLPSTFYNQLPAQARSQAFTVSYLSGVEQIEEVRRQLQRAQELGLTFKEWRDSLKLAQLAPAHASTVFRTNLMGAQNAGRWTQQQSDDRRPYLMYDAVNDSRTRPGHKALDGIIKAKSDPFWREHYPPNGFNCRCQVISLTAAQAKARGGGATITIDPTGRPDTGWAQHPAYGLDRRLQDAVRQASTDPRLAQAAENLLNTRDPISAAWLNNRVAKVSMIKNGRLGQIDLDLESTEAKSLARFSGGLDGSTVVLREMEDGFQTIVVSHPRLPEDFRFSVQYTEGAPLVVFQQLKLVGGSLPAGLGTRIVANVLKEAKELGARDVGLLAGRSPIMTGYRTWPAIGFNAAFDHRAFTQATGVPVPAHLQGAKTILQLVASREGQQFWRQHGVEEFMIFDLTDGSDSWQVLNTVLKKWGAK